MLQYQRNEMKQFFEDNGYLLEKYTKGTHSIQITRHLECGNLYPVTFSNFKYHNSRCPICSGNAPISENEMKQFFENNGYTLEKYTKGSRFNSNYKASRMWKFISSNFFKF